MLLHILNKRLPPTLMQTSATNSTHINPKPLSMWWLRHVESSRIWEKKSAQGFWRPWQAVQSVYKTQVIGYVSCIPPNTALGSTKWKSGSVSWHGVCWNVGSLLQQLNSNDRFLGSSPISMKRLPSPFAGHIRASHWCYKFSMKLSRQGTSASTCFLANLSKPLTSAPHQQDQLESDHTPFPLNR